jgi:hypothetical protein
VLAIGLQVLPQKDLETPSSGKAFSMTLTISFLLLK